MRKLLLFVIILFGCMGTISFSDACSTAICQCVGGANVTFGQYCPAVNTAPSYSRSYKYGAIAINEDNGYWFAITNSYTAKFAKKEVDRKCSETFNGKKCKIIPIKENGCLTVAYSAYDKAVKSKNGAGSKVRENLLKSSGKNYEITTSLCNNYDGNIEYHWKDQ